ncbi:MAG TPA: hypothetical protein DCZ04_15765 [Syntrophorhabdus aromaticivorans]|nr:hypothetical protein [Syntrophorhabdus aromaticivorans]
MRDIFPHTRLIHFCEWYYRAKGGDVGFDPEFPPVFDDLARIRTWNGRRNAISAHVVSFTALRHDPYPSYRA